MMFYYSFYIVHTRIVVTYIYSILELSWYSQLPRIFRWTPNGDPKGFWALFLLLYYYMADFDKSI